jgi:uncharacterized protein YndB with AHSA1/START domain
MTQPIQPFTTTRELAAPRDLVYQVHTQPEHLNKWMGPDGFDSIKSDMDLRAGGVHHYGLQGPGGMQMWGKQEFVAVEPNRKLVYLQSFSDENGGIARHPMAPTWPEKMHATTTFEDAGPGRTRVTIAWHPHESDEAGITTFDGARAGMEQGFAGMWTKLENYLASLQA